MDHHIDNMDVGAFLNVCEQAAAIDGIALGPLRLPQPRARLRAGPLLAVGRRRDAVDAGRVVAAAHRRAPADVRGTPPTISTSCGCTPTTSRPTWQGRCGSWPRASASTSTSRWPRLVQAATFESMRSRADTTVPGGGLEHWIDPAAFFSRGTSGQWRDLLGEADLARYAAPVRALAPDDLVEWLHRELID
jgi:aryl sulfotransferase